MLSLSLALSLACRNEPKDPQQTLDSEPQTHDSPADSPHDSEPVPIDDDGDGYAQEDDCDDQDPDVNPGAQEVA